MDSETLHKSYKFQAACQLAEPRVKSCLQVKGFPTLNCVAKDGTVSTYSGGRTEKELVEFVKKETGSTASKAKHDTEEL